MNEITNWMQGNWYALGSLLAQVAFLFVGVWFARRILKSLRATQQQFGALLKLSLTAGLEEQPKRGETTHRSAVDVAEDRPSPYVMAEWPTVKETPALSLPESEPRQNFLVAAARGVIQWLQTPMASSDGFSSWRKVVRWLQAPARS